MKKEKPCGKCGSVDILISTLGKRRCRACRRACGKSHWLRNKERVLVKNRKCMLLRLYGVTPEWYDKKLAKQGGVCYICKRPERGPRRLAVDHCHATGKVRDLICSGCNTTLGRFQDRPDLILEMAKYLRRHQK